MTTGYTAPTAEKVYDRGIFVSKDYAGQKVKIVYDSRLALYKAIHNQTKKIIFLSKEIFLENVEFRVSQPRRKLHLDGKGRGFYFSFVGTVCGPLYFKRDPLKVQIEPVLWDSFMYYDYQQFVPISTAQALHLYVDDATMQLRVPEAEPELTEEDKAWQLKKE